MRPALRVGLLGPLHVLIALALCAPSVSAQDDAAEPDDGLPSALLFATAVQRGRAVAELDKEIRAAVVEHAPVHLVETASGKKLSALRAAVHCHEESVPCLRAIAQRVGVEVLLLPSLERGAGELTLTFAAFNARADAITRVAHWQDGAEITPETYAALPDLIDGLFPKPGPPDIDFVAEAKAQAQAVAARADRSAAAGPALWQPLLIAGGGVLLLGAAIVTGSMQRSTQADYTALDVQTRRDAEMADSLHSRLRTEATLANVFFGLGSVALAASSVWLGVELFGAANKPEQQRTQLTPWLAPRQVGMVLRHQGGLF